MDFSPTHLVPWQQLLWWPPPTAGAVISSKYCAYGEGTDCENLAKGNAYTLELLKRSAANRKNNEESARNAFNARNDADWFVGVSKPMVHKESNATFILGDDADLHKLRAENTITVKIPPAMGGRVTDATQKPMLVLKEKKLRTTTLSDELSSIKLLIMRKQNKRYHSGSFLKGLGCVMTSEVATQALANNFYIHVRHSWPLVS